VAVRLTGMPRGAGRATVDGRTVLAAAGAGRATALRRGSKLCAVAATVVSANTSAASARKLAANRQKCRRDRSVVMGERGWRDSQ
jgi:hypothetical protein